MRAGSLDRRITLERFTSTVDAYNEPALIVGCGPSAAAVDLEQFQDHLVIAINEAWRLCPWADVLYGTDDAWWDAGRGDGFAGLNVRGSDLRIEGDEISFDPAFIGSGGTGAFQALNLAVQWGVKSIGLIGVDCRLDLGEHWHERSPVQRAALSQSAVDRWIKAFDGAAPVLAAAGVEVVNYSGVSALTGFRKEPLPEVSALHVLFTADYDYTPATGPQTTTAYKAGWSGPVPTPCGRRAIERGRAVAVDAPSREDAVHTGPTPKAPHRKRKA